MKIWYLSGILIMGILGSFVWGWTSGVASCSECWWIDGNSHCVYHEGTNLDCRLRYIGYSGGWLCAEFFNECYDEPPSY